MFFKGNHKPPPCQNKGLRLRLGASGAWKWAVHQISSRIFYWKKGEVWGEEVAWDNELKAGGWGNGVGTSQTLMTSGAG